MTEQVKHTPGPWRLIEGDIHCHDDDDNGGGWSILMGQYGSGGGRTIHRVQYAEDIYPEDKSFAEAEANARLIAEAPALLAALKLMVEINGGLGHSAAVKKAMEVIERAEGR